MVRSSFRVILLVILVPAVACDKRSSSTAPHHTTVTSIDSRDESTSSGRDNTNDGHQDERSVARFWKDAQAAEMVEVLLCLDREKGDAAYMYRWQGGILEGRLVVEDDAGHTEQISLDVPVSSTLKSLADRGYVPQSPVFCGWLLVVLKHNDKSPDGTYRVQVEGVFTCVWKEEFQGKQSEEGSTFHYVSAERPLVLWNSENDKAGRCIQAWGDDFAELKKYINGTESNWLALRFKETAGEEE